MSDEPIESIEQATAHAIDRAFARRAFDRAGATYDEAAALQAEVRHQLLERLDLVDIAPGRVVDMGCGTGHASRALERRYPQAQLIAVDFSMGMLEAAAWRGSWRQPLTRLLAAAGRDHAAAGRLCADAERLPLPDSCADVILSNLMLPWTDCDAAFAEFRRVLAPRGLLTFTTFGPDTLKELREAWLAADRRLADPQGRMSRASRFFDMHDIGDALVRAGFAAPVLDVERYTLKYPDVRRLAADLKALGARDATFGRQKGLTTPRMFAAMEAAYERFRDAGRLPATCEVVFGQAWAPAAPRDSRDTRVPLEEIKRQLRQRRG